MALEQVKGESKKAYQAFCDYAQMGAGRSLALLQNRYQAATELLPPTKRLKSLKDWSRTYHWQDRVALYDQAIVAEREAAAAARRREVMEEGLALDFERTRELKRLAAVLLEEIHDKDKRWVEDFKQIGGGETAEKVRIVRFNAALIEQFRGTLDDIAKEKGDRKARHEVTGKDGVPLDLTIVTMTAAEDEVRAWRERMKAQLNMPNALGPVIISSTST